MMEKHKCKICLRSFTCGRALGGHMRSHIANHSNQPNSEEENVEIPSIPSSSSSEMRENLDFLDRESKTDGMKKAFQIQRIKKNLKEQEPISSTSKTNPDEEIAYCLMMLKRDSWSRRAKVESGERLVEKKQSTRTKARAKYKCDTCFKVFKSYQALGGHRASHKKGLITNRGSKNEEKENGEKTHECPVCFKGFSSGQALGGHKRSHFSGLEANYPPDYPIKKANSMIDLNLPPLTEDADEISQFVSQS